MQLTTNNYYTQEANQEYTSVSQFKDFLACEAAAYAKLKGEYQEEQTEPFLLGGYVHSWNDNSMEEFKIKSPELFSTRGASKGELKAEFKIADKMIETLEKDKLCMMALEGQKEIIMTGTLFGVKWKIRIDVLNLEKGFFTDLKTVKDFNRLWDGTAKVTFIEFYGYLIQVAVYQEIIYQNTGKKLQPYVVAVTKEKVPDKAVLKFNQDELDFELEKVRAHMERIVQVKLGLEKPIRCGKCDYCKSTKKVTKIIHYSELE